MVTQILIGKAQKKPQNIQKDDWARINVTNSKINEKIIANMDKGIDNSEVQNAVNELKQHITDNFYDCTIKIFRGLADLYVNDERFTANIDKDKKGLAKFLSESMIYYCDNAK